MWGVALLGLGRPTEAVVRLARSIRTADRMGSNAMLEQATAALVVEPHGRNRFQRSLEASDGVGLHLDPDVLLGQVYIDRVGHGAQGSRASRTPPKGQRAPGGKKLRYVARV